MGVVFVVTLVSFHKYMTGVWSYLKNFPPEHPLKKHAEEVGEKVDKYTTWVGLVMGIFLFVAFLECLVINR